MKKRSDLTISIILPDDHNATKGSLDPDGNIKILDEAGNEILPEHVERAIHYDRPKGQKYQSRSASVDRNVTVGGLDELDKVESFIVVDTNSVEIEDTRVSAACFSEFKLVKESNGFRLISQDQSNHVYEFHNVSGNPELLAILKIAHDISLNRDLSKRSTIRFITDSDMDSHKAISARQQTIYGKHYLPEGFSLSYASSDTGQELVNKLIKIFDKGSTKYLKRLIDGSFRRTGLTVLEEDPSVMFRFTSYPRNLKITNPIVNGVSMLPGAKIKIEYYDSEGNVIS